jgi:hypothetical protein
MKIGSATMPATGHLNPARFRSEDRDPWYAVALFGIKRVSR